jgi:predicted metal-dependent hydrolase
VSKPYLYGVDLFNHQYYWESHEQFEALWLAAGRKGPVADLLKGLIKLAAAGVKHREGKPPGVHSHAERAAKLFRSVARSLKLEKEPFLGLRINELVDLADHIAQEGWPAQWPVLQIHPE